MGWLRRTLFTRENVIVLVLVFILVCLIIFTSDSGPTWIYQGF